MRLIILGAFLILVACAQVKLIENKESAKVSLNKYPHMPLPLQVSPGMVKYFEFETSLPVGSYTMSCKDFQVNFLVADKLAKGYLSESYFSDMKPFMCTMSEGEKIFNILSVTIAPYPFKKEKLNVDKKRVVLSPKDLERVLREKEIKKRIYQNSADSFLFQGPFISPLDSKITSYYGTKRLFNNHKQSQHLGNDFRAQVGVPIPVANDGKVAFTGNLFFSGNIVIVDHGMNIFSAYGHLSDIQVTEGSFIRKGNIVGLSGATGRVSGPHLHWGLKVNGHWVDGFSMVRETGSTKIVHNE